MTGVQTCALPILTREMFKIALGYIEYDVRNERQVIHKPNAGMIALIFDRMEGRAPLSNDGNKKQRTLPNKVSDENKKRLNRLAQSGQ